MGLGVGGQVVGAFRVPAVAPDHRGGDEFAAVFVFGAEDGDLGDAGMAEKRVFDFGGIDFPAGEDDHVLFAVGDEEAVVGVEVADVAGQEPSVGEEVLGGGFGAVPVALGDGGAAEGDFAGFAAGFLGGGVEFVDDLDLGEADGVADALEAVGRGVVFGADDGAGADDDGFGEAVGVEDGDVEALVPLLPYAVVEGAAAGDDAADRGERVLGGGRGLGEEGVDDGGHPGEERDAVRAAEVEVGGELVAGHHDVEGAGAHRGDAPGEADVAHGVDAEVGVGLAAVEDVALVVDRGEPVAVREHRALGLAGGAGGVLQLAEVVEVGVLRREHGGAAPGFDVAGDVRGHGDGQRGEELGAGGVGHDEGSAGIADEVGEFVAGVDAVAGDGDGADAPDGEVGEEVLGGAVEVEGDAVALADAAFLEGAGHLGGDGEDFGGVVPRAALGAVEDGLAEAARVGVEEGRDVQHGVFSWKRGAGVPRAIPGTIPPARPPLQARKRAGVKFSNDWKTFFQSLEKTARFFQPLEKFPWGFPTIGKKFPRWPGPGPGTENGIPGDGDAAVGPDGAPESVLADDRADDAADFQGAARADEFVLAVGGFETDPGLVLHVVFERPFVVHARDDDVALLRGGPLLDQHEVAGLDAGVDHGIAADRQHEGVVGIADEVFVEGDGFRLLLLFLRGEARDDGAEVADAAGEFGQEGELAVLGLEEVSALFEVADETEDRVLGFVAEKAEHFGVGRGTVFRTPEGAELEDLVVEDQFAWHGVSPVWVCMYDHTAPRTVAQERNFGNRRFRGAPRPDVPRVRREGGGGESGAMSFMVGTLTEKAWK